MNRNCKKFIGEIGISVVLFYGGAGSVQGVVAEDSTSFGNQAELITSAATQCPTDISFLQPKMEKALRYIKSSSFRETMLASMQASIPEALVRTDGLARQIDSLKREIVRQEQERAHAEEIAREGLSDPSQELKPCRHGKEGAYCYAMDQYLVSTASNLANHAFLEALECYQRVGVR
jgi:hypothetical protein